MCPHVNKCCKPWLTCFTVAPPKRCCGRVDATRPLTDVQQRNKGCIACFPAFTGACQHAAQPKKDYATKERERERGLFWNIKIRNEEGQVFLDWVGWTLIHYCGFPTKSFFLSKIVEACGEGCIVGGSHPWVPMKPRKLDLQGSGHRTTLQGK